ncbi:MAG: hypothetical protein L6V35_00345 [Alistipes putredinis]|nr:MAG: hypothetical protein L6V35_00345 [Alistipes putredinis]
MEYSGRPFYPHAESPIKRQLIEEINALDIEGMPEVDNLFVLQGSFINQEYRLNGNSVFLLDNDASYWGTQALRKTECRGTLFRHRMRREIHPRFGIRQGWQ